MTYANWEVRHMGNSTSRGRFDHKSGSIMLDRAGKAGSVDISVEIASISTGWVGFDNRVKRLLDAEAHPVARFTSSDFRFEGERLASVVGDLTFRGIQIEGIRQDEAAAAREAARSPQ